MSKNKEESLHELMAGMKPRGKEPRNAGVLDSWIDHAEADFGIAASGRVRWLIASTVITAMLQQVVDDDNACRFCTVHSVCGFDRRLDGCEKRRLTPLNKDEIWRRLEEEES